jgi:hypothetical protein
MAFLSDQETPKTDPTSWVVLAIASILWPVSFPLSCVELLTSSESDSSSFNGEELA